MSLRTTLYAIAFAIVATWLATVICSPGCPGRRWHQWREQMQERREERRESIDQDQNERLPWRERFRRRQES